MIFISFNLLIARKNYAGKVGKTQIITAHIQTLKHTPDTQGHTYKHTHTQTHKDTHITHTYKQVLMNTQRHTHNTETHV